MIEGSISIDFFCFHVTSSILSQGANLCLLLCSRMVIGGIIVMFIDYLGDFVYYDALCLSLKCLVVDKRL
jgi:hypothetical protein